MTEAVRAVIDWLFGQQGLDFLLIYHYEHNTRSRRVINKCGFKFEGVTRKALEDPWFGLCDRWAYSMTEREWRQTVVNE